MKKVLFALLAVFIIIQFISIDKTNPPVDKSKDFLALKKTPQDIAQLIRNSCYDCHSNETKYPWYAKIQPVAWYLKDHIDEGREELNFSEFANYEAIRQAKKMRKSANEIEEGEMPLESYTLIHQKAKLTSEQKEKLQKYFTSIKEQIMQENNISEEQMKPKKH
jgi:hypothetical protein